MDPWVEENLPKLDAGWRYLFSAVVTAAVLESVLQIALGWPTVVIHWEDKDEHVPISDIVARATKRRPDSQAFVLKISTPNGGWLGYQVMRAWMRLGVVLEIRIDRAAIVATVDGSSMTSNQPNVTPDDNSNGVVIELGRAPRRPGKWHWANVRWRVVDMSQGVKVNVDCVLHHQNAFVRFLLLIFVRRSTNVRHFQVVGA